MSGRPRFHRPHYERHLAPGIEELLVALNDGPWSRKEVLLFVIEQVGPVWLAAQGEAERRAIVEEVHRIGRHARLGHRPPRS